MVNNIGAALSIFIAATQEPVIAPTANRTLPTIELAVPASSGNFSKIDAVALEEINGFCPTKKAIPIAIGQKPQSNRAVSTNTIAAINCTLNPKRNM